MKKVLMIVLCLVFLLSLLVISCGDTNTCGDTNKGESQQTQQTNVLLDEINREIGLPNINNFQQKKLMKMIYEICDQENLVCYAYIKSDYQGKLVFIGKCMGFGIPFSAQYTNPQKLVDRRGNISSGSLRNLYTLPQADPNGIYMPTSSSATWLLMLDSKGEPRPVYLEPEIVVSPFPLNF